MPLCQPSARFAVIGQPVDHSLSPYIHKNFASQWSVDLDYGRLEISSAKLVKGLARFAAEGGVGANVTLPHKRAVMDLCGELAPRARRAQSVNTLSVIDGVWHGDNTDGVGLVNDLCLRRNIDLRGRQANATRLVHGLHHVIDQGVDAGVHRLHRFGHLVQARVGVAKDG